MGRSKIEVYYVPNWVEVRCKMIKIIVKEEMYIYDMYHILRAFYPGSEIDQTIDSGVPNLIELRIDGQRKRVSFDQPK